MKHIIINHPDGDITLEELQQDVNAWNNNISNTNAFGFTSKTVQALINKIVELSPVKGYAHNTDAIISVQNRTGVEL